MKLTDIYTKTMEQILSECDIIKQNIHTDDDGNIASIEIKYKPKDTSKDTSNKCKSGGF